MATDETTSKAVQASSSPERPPTAAQQRATQHQGTSDTEVLVDDIEKTREELASTIDEIVDRVSPKKVVERTKAQATEAAKQGVSDATAIVKETAGVVREKAATAGELLKEKTGTATEAVKGKAAAVKDKVGSGGDADSVAVTGATSVAIGSAGSASPSPGSGTAGAAPTGSSTAAGDESVPLSPLPADTVSVDAGAVPPSDPADALTLTAAPAATPRSSASATPTPAASLSPARTSGSSGAPSGAPVFAGAGVAAAVALLLALLRRRRRRR